MNREEIERALEPYGPGIRLVDVEFEGDAMLLTIGAAMPREEVINLLPLIRRTAREVFPRASSIRLRITHG